MDENQEDRPLSSEELLRRAREGLGEPDTVRETPADFSVESYPPPAVDVPSEPPSFDETDVPTYDESTYEQSPSVFDPPVTESRNEPASWAPPPVDPASPADRTATAPTGPGPAPARRGGGLASKLWILVVIAVVGVGVFSLFDNSKTVDDIAVGDCMNIPEEDVFSTVDTIDCTEPHDLEVFALVDLSDIGVEFSSIASYPGDDPVYEASFNACWDAFESYVGVPYEDSAIYLDVFTPTLEGWDERGDRIANCVLYQVNADATDLIQSRSSLRGVNR